MQARGSIRWQWHTGWLAWVTVAATGVAAERLPAQRDAATHEQLAQRLQQAQQEDPMQRLPESTGEDPAKDPPQDLLSQSDVLCFGGMATLVPKRAILRLPPPLVQRLEFIRGSALVGWAEFYARNRGWITAVEVSRAQAEGHEPLAADVLMRLKESSALVVATYLGGPISVLPPKVSPPEKPAATAAPPAMIKP